MNQLNSLLNENWSRQKLRRKLTFPLVLLPSPYVPKFTMPPFFVALKFIAGYLLGGLGFVLKCSFFLN